jgi:Tfp pilus assembly protein PilN
MPEINLLPQEKKDANSGLKLNATTKKIGRVGLIIFGIAISLYGGIYLYFLVRNQFVSSSKTELESQIQSLQPTEQKIVLLRDRISKTGKVFSSPSAATKSSLLASLSESLPDGVNITEVKILPEEFTITISASQSKQVSEFIRSMVSSGNYGRIELTSLAYSNKDRYVMEIKATSAQTQ